MGEYSPQVMAELEQLQSKYYGGVRFYDLLMESHRGDPRPTVRVIEGNGELREYSFEEVDSRARSYADLLRQLGVSKADRVATLVPKGFELACLILGIYHLGAVQVPLFTAFERDAASFRAVHSGSKVVVTDANNVHKLAHLEVPIVVVNLKEGELPSREALTISGIQLAAVSQERPCFTEAEDAILMIYTSGTTGDPKGVMWTVRAFASIESYHHFGLDLKREDNFWNVADPGWAFGLGNGFIAALLRGTPLNILAKPFDPPSFYDALERFEVTNLAGAPTVFRALRAAGGHKGGKKYALRAISSAGEPINPEVSQWVKSQLGEEVFDHYGQTEVGMPVVNHQNPLLRSELRPGSMGKGAPGFKAVVVSGEHQPLPPGVEGEIALEVAESSLFWYKGYFQNSSKSAERFSQDGRFYLTSDAASMDEEGYLYFSGRTDDVISSSGYRVGPFEVESAIITHPAVAEVAVIGVPDPVRVEAVKAFVVLVEGVVPTEELAKEIQEHVRSRWSKHAYPRSVEFIAELPKTPSGKVQRFLLRKL